MIPEARPLVVLGPTASGKSAVAMRIATHVTGIELVSIDSMQVYRGMDIGTAKPSADERARVPHHLIDLVDASEPFTVADFQVAFRTAMADIRRRGAEPVLVGGTGLHLRASIDDLTLPGQYPEVRDALELEADTIELHQRLQQLDPTAADRMEPSNRRRVVRALEVTIGSGRPFSDFGPGLTSYPPSAYRLLGLRWPRDVLDRRIEERYRAQLAAGFLEEVRRLAESEHGLSTTAAQALGYKELLAHVRGELGEDEAVELAITRTRRFARRQERWFRRDPRIEWIDVADEDDLRRLADALIVGSSPP